MNTSNGKRLASLILLLATLAVAVLNGLPSSLYFDPMGFWAGKVFGREWMNSTVGFYANSVLVTLVTLIVSWLPAAAFRKVIPHLVGPLGYRFIWFAGAALIAWPALEMLVGFEE
jgi:hypothetical protein